MFKIIWEYQIKQSHRSDFLQIYATYGAWAQLFSKAEGYIETQLLEDNINPNRFMTIDVWKSEKHFENFKKNFNTEYQKIR